MSTSGGATSVELAVVVPAYQAACFLVRSLPALRRAAPDLPIVVVDAGSSDETGSIARELGATTVRLPEREGPAGARNAGVKAVAAEVVLFVDADCVLHDDAIARVREAFRAEPELVGLCGSYDARPPERNFFSLYMNLRHHYTHQRARREPASFWAGCGAVRRDAFLRAGGFDATRYPRPEIEDIELAVRLRRQGRLRLDPDLQVTHLKRWTFRSVVETDLLRRALPWARLIRQTGELPDDLNLRLAERLAAGVAPLALLALPLGPWALASGRPFLAAACAAALATSVALAGGMLACFTRQAGVSFAARAWLFHQLHLVYSALVFASVAWLRRSRAPQRSG
jgi:GT2 family glycosyltransferase